MKNFVANNNHSSCWSWSCIEIRAKELVTDWRLCNKGKKVATRLSPNGYWSKDSTVGLFWDRTGSTCNHLIIINEFLGVVTLNSPDGVFYLARGFTHLSTNHHVNLFSIAF